jgi:hypothetical protein
MYARIHGYYWNMGAIYLAPVELTHTYIKRTVAGDFSVLVFFYQTVPLCTPGHCEKRFCLDSHIRLVIRIQRLLSAVCVTAKYVLVLSTSSGNKLTDDADIAEH